MQLSSMMLDYEQEWLKMVNCFKRFLQIPWLQVMGPCYDGTTIPESTVAAQAARITSYFCYFLVLSLLVAILVTSTEAGITSAFNL